MKKAYSKPKIVFESFSLSVSIAACQTEAAFNPTLGKWNCKGYYDDQFSVIFFSTPETGCDFTPSDLKYDQLCYDVPSISLGLFGS